MFHYYSQTTSVLIVFSLVVFVLIANCEAQPVTSSRLSEQRFPTDEFFGGISVDLDRLQEHPRYQLFPLDELIPAKTSFGYFNNELISQFAFFLKARDESKRGSHQRFEIAAVGKLRAPSSFDVKAELAKWSNLTTPWRPNHEIEVEEIQVSGKSCFKFESGTILNSIQRPGTVQFYGRKGERSSGISSGEPVKRRFVVGGNNDSKAAIFIPDVSSSDLIDGSLIVDLHLDVLLGSKLDHPFPKSQIYLLSSDGKTRSYLINFDTKSFFVHRFSFPQKLPVFDAESGEPRGIVDLFDNFVTDGELQLVLRCLDEFTYVGVHDLDVGLRIPSHEYLGVVGDYAVVTQSLDSLKQMVEMDPKAIDEKTGLEDGLQVEASFNLAKPGNRTAFEHFLKSLELQHVLSAMSSTTQHVQCSINMDQQQIFSAKIGMSAGDARSSASKISLACNEVTKPRVLHEDHGFGYKLDDGSERIASALATELYNSTLRQNSMARVREMLFGVVWGMPVHADGTKYAQVAIFPDSSIDDKQLGRSFQTFAETLKESVRVNGGADGLVIGFLWPFREPGVIDQADLLTFASIRRYRSREYFLMKRFHLSEQMQRRLISEFTDSRALWSSLSHQLTFHTSMEFDGKSTQYFWVRKGINVLLDVADSNKNSMDAVWEAAKYIWSKIGVSDEHVEFRKLFASDKALLERVGKYVDVQKCKDGDGKIDCQLVAQGMLLYCRDRIRETNKVESSISRLELDVLPIVMRAQHARWLDQQFDSRTASTQWQKVQKEFLELEEMDSEYASWHESKLAKIRMRLSTAWQEVLAFYSKSQGLWDANDHEESLVQLESALGLVQKLLDEDLGNIEVVQSVFRDLLETAKSQFKQMEKPIPAPYHDLFQKTALPWLK